MPDPQPKRGRIIVFGIVFWYPLAGVTYQFLHYLLGLQKLGYDVYYVEDCQRDVYDPTLNDYTYDVTNNVNMLAPVLEAHGFANRWACRDVAGQCFGMTVPELEALYRTADGFLNVCGGHEVRDEHRVIPIRVYVESDPFSMQVNYVQKKQGIENFVDAHNRFFTFGENIGQPDCGIPATGHNWMTTRQPVHMDLWKSPETGGSTYNTITTWHNKTPPLEWQGSFYQWTKDIEFKKIIDLPQRRPHCRFELACGVEASIRDFITSNGWSNVDSVGLSSDVNVYRQYIMNSRAEFTVARDQYTRPRTGWFSDRTVCYLAAGRPVITGETGFSKTVRSGKGLFGFSTMDEILAAVDAIESDYAGNCRAAREIAAEYFASEKVLSSLMSRAGLA